MKSIKAPDPAVPHSGPGGLVKADAWLITWKGTTEKAWRV